MRLIRVMFLGLLVCVAARSAVLGDLADKDPSAKEPFVAVEDKTVTYAGKISERNVERFLDATRGKQLATLVISSSGGEINAGMRMGSWVFDNGVDVIVEQMCMSSCANYLFTAGRRKIIKPGAIVAWHGNALQESGMSEEDVRTSVIQTFNQLPESEKAKINLEEQIRRSIEEMSRYRTESIRRQTDFFRRIGVDESVCRIGNDEYGARDFFILSVKDMERFGIVNVEAPDNYEKTDLAPFCVRGKHVEYIKLGR